MHALLKADHLGSFFTDVITKPPSNDRRIMAAAYDEGRLLLSDFQKYLALATIKVSEEELQARAGETAKCISEQLRGVPLPLPDAFQLLTIYHQCDVGGYTLDCGGYPALDFAFELTLPDMPRITRETLPPRMFSPHPEKIRLRYGPSYEHAYHVLERHLLGVNY